MPPKMDKPVIVFDLDDTLIDLKTELYTALHTDFGKDRVPHWSLWDTHNVENIVGIGVKEFIKCSVKHEIYLTAKPNIFAKPMLKDLSARGYHVVILTARGGFVPKAFEKTEKYLADHDLVCDELIISNIGENKMDSLTKFDNIKCTVDDSAKNCKDMLASGKVEHVFLHALPNNVNSLEYIRIHNLYQIYPYLGLS
jgi:5'(3')-deoxyribonucleotidase